MDRASAAEVAPGLPARRWYLGILALSGFVTSFGAHIVVMMRLRWPISAQSRTR